MINPIFVSQSATQSSAPGSAVVPGPNRTVPQSPSYSPSVAGQPSTHRDSLGQQSSNAQSLETHFVRKPVVGENGLEVRPASADDPTTPTNSDAGRKSESTSSPSVQSVLGNSGANPAPSIQKQNEFVTRVLPDGSVVRERIISVGYYAAPAVSTIPASANAVSTANASASVIYSQPQSQPQQYYSNSSTYTQQPYYSNSNSSNSYYSGGRRFIGRWR